MKTNNIFKNIAGALALATLAACGDSGSCPPGQSGELSLAITAPNQYPAGVAVTAYLTMTNTSTVNATNLYYAVPAATNYTGSNNITIQNGVGNNPCVNIAAGASCTFPAQISANSHPGSFTVTATPNGSSSQSSISKLVTKVETKLGLQSGSLELTANIGLSNVPANNNSGANGITFLYAKTVKQNANGATLVSIVGVVKSATAGTFNNINLTDANGNLLKFENISGASTSPLAQNSVVTFLLEIPAGVNSYDFYGQTTNNGEPENQGTAKNTINLVDDSVGILNAQPVTFNLQSGYESQVVTYTNTGLGAVSNINITLPEPLTLISNGCSGKTLASGDFCNYSLRFNPASLVSGTTTLVATYNNGQSTNNEVDSTITYTALAPQAGLAISGNSNPNFNFSSNTVQTIESSLVTLTNSGSRPLYGLAFDVPTHFTTSVSGVASPCGSTLAVGSSCNFSLIYTNGTVTPATQATAKVNYKYTGINQQEHSGSSQMTLTYQTTQAMAALSITPAAQAFGNVLNNNSATSPQQTFTVVNGGPNPASAVSPSFTESNAALFNITSSNCGSSIPANSSCTITAKFGPFASSTAAGSKAAQLTIQYKPYAGSTSTLTAKSTVTGQAVSAQSAMIDLSSAVAAGFESGTGTAGIPYTVTTGNSAPTLTYTLTNSGNVPATSFYLNTAALSGKWTLSSNSCGTSNAKVTLAKGGSCNFTVRIASTATVQANNFVPSEIEANWVDEDSPAPDGQSQNLAGNTVYASIIALPTITVTASQDPVAGGACAGISASIPAAVSSPITVTFTVAPVSANAYGFGSGPGGAPFASTASCTITNPDTTCHTADGGDLCAATGSGGTEITVTGSASGYQSGSAPVTIKSSPFNIFQTDTSGGYAVPAGGVSSFDAACVDYAVTNNIPGDYKALIATATRYAGGSDWVIQPDTHYQAIYSNGSGGFEYQDLFTSDSNGKPPVTLSNNIYGFTNKGQSYAWGGFQNNEFYYDPTLTSGNSQNCTNWTSNSSSLSPKYLYTALAASQPNWSTTNASGSSDPARVNCAGNGYQQDGNMQLVCVQQPPPPACGDGGNCRIFTTANFTRADGGANLPAVANTLGRGSFTDGFQAGDAICEYNAEQNSYSGTYKALIAGTNRQPGGSDWVIKASTPYTRGDGTVIGTSTAGAQLPATLTNSISTSMTPALNGFALNSEPWVVDTTYGNCNNWTSATSGTYVYNGTPSGTITVGPAGLPPGAGYLSSLGMQIGCDSLTSVLYCVQQ